MNKRALTAALISLALAACTSAPTITPTPLVSSSPAPTPTSVVTLAPSTPPTESPSPTPPPTPTPTPTKTAIPTPTATPTPTAPPAAWPEPERVSRGSFTDVDLAIDAAGAAHVAAVGTGSDNKGLWYLTNVTGRWVKEQLTSPLVDENDNIGEEGEPSIAVDPTDGSVWIAFSRWDCAECIPSATLGIFYVTNQGGAWSEPVQLSRGWDLGPSLAVRNGHFYVSYSTTGFPGDRQPVWFASNASGILVTQQVAQTGRSPHLVLDADGRARILFSTDGLRFARQRADGTFAIERLPGASGRLNSRLVLDSVTKSYWAAWTAYVDDGPDVNVVLTSRGPDGWADPTWAIPDGRLHGLGSYDGLVQLTAYVAGSDYRVGLIYATNDAEVFEGRWVLDPGGADSSAFALGPIGSPFVVYTQDGQSGIWFLKGPGV